MKKFYKPYLGKITGRHKSWCQMYASVIIFILLVWRLPYSLRPLICRGCYACEIDTCKWSTVYIYFRTVVYFADQVYTRFWAVRAEQHVQYIWFLPKTSQEENKAFRPNKYILWNGANSRLGNEIIFQYNSDSGLSAVSNRTKIIYSQEIRISESCMRN